jgi:hypothetical protein
LNAPQQSPFAYSNKPEGFEFQKSKEKKSLPLSDRKTDDKD